MDRPHKTSSMKCWIVWAVLRNTNGILMHSNKPSGMMMAVFGMSAGLTGIWLNALTRSILEKMVQPESCEENS